MEKAVKSMCLYNSTNHSNAAFPTIPHAMVPLEFRVRTHSCSSDYQLGSGSPSNAHNKTMQCCWDRHSSKQR